MKGKQILIAGLAALLIGTPLYQAEAQNAKGEAKTVQIGVKTKLMEKEVVKTINEWMKKQSYVQSGGSYGEGEYISFPLKGTTYRYLAKDIDTKKELLRYLKQSVTAEYAKRFIKEKGIIEHKGKLAQVEADGGSILQWEKVIAQFEGKEGKARNYKLIVPVGDTGDHEVYKASLVYENKGWKVSKVEFSHFVDLNVPFNINPAFIFFKYLLIDSSESEAQFIKQGIFDVDAFKQGIKKVEVRNMEEQGRFRNQVEFKVSFDVELAKGYSGSLKEGKNVMYFLVENTGEMEYKIVKAGMDSQLKQN
jgi:hypothetical protein